MEKKWCVITDDLSRAERQYEGNLATAIVYGPGGEPSGAALGYSMPVFTTGEIFIVDGEYGRELHGAGRKPSKWGIAYEEFDFDKYEEAAARAIQVSRV